jgi:cardiolipin synthase
VVLIIFGRDLWILSLSALAFRFTSFRNFQPSHWGKASTFLQIMTAIGVMAAKGYSDTLLARICTALIVGIIVLAVISASEYTWRGIMWLRSPKSSVAGVDLTASRE